MYFIHCLNSGKVIGQITYGNRLSITHRNGKKILLCTVHIASPGYNIIPLHSPRALFPHSFKDLDTPVIIRLFFLKNFFNIITGVHYFNCRLNWIISYFRCDFKTDSVVLYIHETLDYLLKMYKTIKK